jgi:hypothetical protein
MAEEGEYVEIVDGFKADCPDCGLPVNIGYSKATGVPVGVHKAPPCKTWDDLELDEFVKLVRLRAEGKLDS